MMFIPATFAAIAPEPKPVLPMRWSDVEAQLGVQLEAPTAESALRNIEGRDRLRASPAWQAGVVGTVEELDALEAAVLSVGLEASMDDVVCALRKGRRETEQAAFGASPTLQWVTPSPTVAPSEFIARPSKIRLRRRPERHE